MSLGHKMPRSGVWEWGLNRAGGRRDCLAALALRWPRAGGELENAVGLEAPGRQARSTLAGTAFCHCFARGDLGTGLLAFPKGLKYHDWNYDRTLRSTYNQLNALFCDNYNVFFKARNEY